MGRVIAALGVVTGCDAFSLRSELGGTYAPLIQVGKLDTLLRINMSDGKTRLKYDRIIEGPQLVGPLLNNKN